MQPCPANRTLDLRSWARYTHYYIRNASSFIFCHKEQAPSGLFLIRKEQSWDAESLGVLGVSVRLQRSFATRGSIFWARLPLLRGSHDNLLPSLMPGWVPSCCLQWCGHQPRPAGENPTL